jgi:hypothetical protein
MAAIVSKMTWMCRHLAKLDQANEDGWLELRYQDEEAELREAIGKTLRTILERDGVKYYKEVAGNLIDAIATDVERRAIILKESRRATDQDMIRRA